MRPVVQKVFQEVQIANQAAAVFVATFGVFQFPI